MILENRNPAVQKRSGNFARENYGITFPLWKKFQLKAMIWPLFIRWLTSKKENGVKDSEVTWNFQKYLIDENGNLVEVLDPKEKVTSDKVMHGFLQNNIRISIREERGCGYNGCNVFFAGNSQYWTCLAVQYRNVSAVGAGPISNISGN